MTIKTEKDTFFLFFLFLFLFLFSLSLKTKNLGTEHFQGRQDVNFLLSSIWNEKILSANFCPQLAKHSVVVVVFFKNIIARKRHCTSCLKFGFSSFNASLKASHSTSGVSVVWSTQAFRAPTAADRNNGWNRIYNYEQRHTHTNHMQILSHFNISI